VARLNAPVTRLEIALCSAIVLFGASIRLPGLSASDLWEDDAWLVLPAKVGLHQALRMDVSTPLFLLVLRQWALLDPGTTAFIQFLPLVASIAGIAALWWLVRTLGGSLWTRAIVTLFGAVTPDAVEYSVRVKEYSVEVLLGLLLLIGLAKAVEHPTPRRAMTLLVLSVLACLTSGVLVLFVAAVLAAYVLFGVRRRDRLDRWWEASVAGTGIAIGATYLAFYDQIPPALQRFWSTFEFTPSNTHTWNQTLSIIGEGVAHGFLGTPLLVGQFPDAFSAITKTQYEHASWLAMVLLVVVLAIMAHVLWRARSDTSGRSAAGVASVVVLVVASVASATGHAPLGGGRTDMWWYPAAWCTLAIVLDDLLRAVVPGPRTGSGVRRRSIAVACGALLLVVAVPFGIHFRAWYPTQDVRALLREHQAQILPTDWVFVARPVSFAWAYYGLGPFHIVFDDTGVQTEQGWSVSVDRFDVQRLLSTDPAVLCRRTRRIWWIGSNPYASNPNNYRITTGSLLREVDQTMAPFTTLLSLGWSRTQVIVGNGVNAQLFTHPGACT
jgi:hypothetical protein